MPKSYEAFRIRPFLPDELAPLSELAYNLHWSWHHETIDLFRRLDRDLWDLTYHNPVKMLGMVKQEMLAQAAQDSGFIDQMHRVHRNLREHITRTSWFDNKYGHNDSPQFAYFSMEFGLSECLPIYSGGLGVLAGDHLKSASELGLPLVGVGLLYQRGYFQQYLNADGWQQETYPDNDFYNLPVQPILGADEQPLQIEIPFPGQNVFARIWRAQVGRIPLYLLDTNIPDNRPEDRSITNQLYGGDSETRIRQEMILGVGGMLALRCLGIHVTVCHMNEGHAAFMALERIRHRIEKDNLSPAEALEVVKAGTFFTTHTPVPAGIDEFEAPLVEKYVGGFLDQCGIDLDSFLSLGRWNPRNASEGLNMALLALRTTSFANGVSRLHGEVSRRMFHSIWPEAPVDEAPIGHVTNGIHTRSWTSPEMSDLLVRYLGPDWLKKPADESVWRRVDEIPNLELWRVHERRRERLVAFTRRRLVDQLKRRGAGIKEVDLAGEVLNPEALTIGFARRFATYKRATLLMKDPARLKKIMTNTDRPVQFIFAGKAHPRDNEGKELIKQLIHFSREADVRNHVVFLENYDMNVARYLVQGVDVWMNTPRRPMEASGTSGMKVIPNGGMNLSILDGWWCEGFEHDTGWAIGAGEDYNHPEYQDEVESKDLYDVLEREVVPLFYDRRGENPPTEWVRRMKSSMKKLGPMFSTNRMVREYAERCYVPAQESWRKLSSDNFARGRKVSEFKQRIRDNWDQVQIKKARVQDQTGLVGVALKIDAEVVLGALNHEDVIVQVYSGPLDADRNITHGQVEELKPTDRNGQGVQCYEGYVACDESGLFGYSIRIMPCHEDLVDSFGLEKMRWIDSSPEIDQSEEVFARETVRG